MLLYVKEKNMIINLDQIRSIFTYDDDEDLWIHAVSTNGEIILICECENKEEASKIINDIYTKMTYGNENMILDLEDYRNHCIDCIKYKTDACTIWENLDPQDTICIDFLGEEGEENVNEEK